MAQQAAMSAYRILDTKTMKKPEYEQLKLKTKKAYSKIGRIHSPALNDEYVAFTSKGFTHLIRKGRNPRPRNEQAKRFLLIPYAEQIIRNPRVTILYRSIETKYYINRHGQKILTTSTAHFWTFVESNKDTKIKVVVRQLNQGPKHFFSIMGNNQKRRSSKNKKSP